MSTNFLEYSNSTLTNIFPKESFEELVQDVFNIVSVNISKSLGPLGSSATIMQGLLPPEATKDGYHIMESYRFRNDYKRLIFNLIKAPCNRMNNIVGDGTTTAITLTAAMFDRYKTRKPVLETLYRLPRQFIKAWDSVIDELQKRVMEKSTPINPKDYDTIYNIAYVTSNGNDEVSKAIATVYAEAEAPYIKQQDSPNNTSYIESVSGFNFPAHLISDAYVKNEDMSTKEDDVAVMVFSDKIDTEIFEKLIIPVNEVYRAKGKKVIIVAPMYDKLMCDSVVAPYAAKERRVRGGINLILIQYALSDLPKHQLLDLCVVLRTKIINDVIRDLMLEELSNKSIDAIIELIETDPDYSLTRTIGFAESVKMSAIKSVGCLFKVDDSILTDDTYIDTLRSARNSLTELLTHTDEERSSYSHEVYKVRDRILQLEMKNYIYYVGADSKLQKKILWDSITDVIKCVRSAVKCGTVPGCQISVMKSCDEMTVEIENAHENVKFEDLPEQDRLKLEIIMIVKTACMSVYNKVLNGPDGIGIIKTLPRWQFTTEDGIHALTEEAINKTSDIINESISKNAVFDLETLEFSNSIITSAETDQLVLLAASELIKILISGNQAIIIREDVDTSHEETVDM